MQTYFSLKDIRKLQHQSNGGAERDRTADPLLAKQVLSQLSYSPIFDAHRITPWARPVCPQRSKIARTNKLKETDWAHQTEGMVGPGRLELPTSRLSGVRSNHLSYGPGRRRSRHQAANQTAEYRYQGPNSGP